MIFVVLVIGGLVFAGFLILVIGIHRTERHHGLLDPYADGIFGAFARRVLCVYVRQIQVHDQDHKHCHGQVGR